MVLKRGGHFFEVITVGGTGHRCVFECMEIDSKQRQVFTYGILRLLETLDVAARVLRDPKDILLVDLNNQGKWKILSKDEVDRIARS